MSKIIPGAVFVMALCGFGGALHGQDGLGGDFGGSGMMSPDEAVVLDPSGADPDDPLGLGLESATITRSKLIADGTYLSRWTGRLVESAPDLWVFAFDSYADGASPGPVMAVLPGQRLVEMQQMVRDRSGDVSFRVGGHVTIFDGRNYFLPRVVTTVSRPPVAAERPASEPTVDGAGEDPSVEELMARVREAAPPAEIVMRTRQNEQDEDVRLMSEGTSVLSVVGRAVRRDEGAVEFVVDNGVSGAASIDASAILMPSLMTQEIGRLVDERGDRVRFSLSGEVFVYGGRNYVMPVLYRIEPRERGNGLRPAR